MDDVESVRRLLRRVLEHTGHRVIEAGDGVEALACLAENPAVDLVITDLRMPNMDGWELATGLSGQSPRIPVLFMSGFDEHLAVETVAGPVLPKPFTRSNSTSTCGRYWEPTGRRGGRRRERYNT